MSEDTFTLIVRENESGELDGWPFEAITADAYEFVSRHLAKGQGIAGTYKLTEEEAARLSIQRRSDGELWLLFD